MAVAIEDLRKQLRERFPQAHAIVHPSSSIPSSEAFSPDAFPPGAISEVIGSGLGMLVAHLLGEPEDHAGFPEFVLVDGSDAFDPASFTADACSRLLWVRCRDAEKMLKAADLLVRDGNVPFVLLDTCGIDRRELARLPASVWWRLKLAAEKNACRLVVMSARPQVPCATLRLSLNHRLELDDFDRPRRELRDRLEVTRERERRSG
ncbi:hypothetical protein [Haloferula sargassicola]|uniref:DNA recombination and repair protein Rad51-like C-terminal domain-containing protein n=1 Tax=Haloferula sargassicola TaxID=490096 RepID=A0ABP9UQU1_9BACT